MQLADVTAIEAMTGYEEQKEKIKYLEERLAQAECQIVEGDELRKKLHNTILVIYLKTWFLALSIYNMLIINLVFIGMILFSQKSF